jgi:glycosyltransferase involved in cell wall biosynthesis
VAVLIPSYQPTGRLAEVVAGLRRLEPDLAVLVVDDGSGPGYDAQFRAAAAAGAEVVRYPRNAGKGAARRTGLRHLLATRRGEDVVTADSDGQHTAGDIVAVARAVAGGSDLVLGCRGFASGVPWPSRLGNSVMRGLFRLAAGFAVSDTQTGLRGIPAGLVSWAAGIGGDRFEYEQHVLLRCREAGITVREVPIETIYFDDNAGTHFRKVTDSARVLGALLGPALGQVARFAGSSLLAVAVDNVLFVLLHGLLGSLAGAMVLARLGSGGVNFAVNRRLVFPGSRGTVGRQVAGYLGLAAVLLSLSITGTWLLVAAGVPALAAKLGCDGVLFLASYRVQRRVVFAGSRAGVPAAGAAPAAELVGTRP